MFRAIMRRSAERRHALRGLGALLFKFSGGTVLGGTPNTARETHALPISPLSDHRPAIPPSLHHSIASAIPDFLAKGA